MKLELLKKKRLLLRDGYIKKAAEQLPQQLLPVQCTASISLSKDIARKRPEFTGNFIQPLQHLHEVAVLAWLSQRLDSDLPERAEIGHFTRHGPPHWRAATRGEFCYTDSSTCKIKKLID